MFPVIRFLIICLLIVFVYGCRTQEPAPIIFKETFSKDKHGKGYDVDKLQEGMSVDGKYRFSQVEVDNYSSKDSDDPKECVDNSAGDKSLLKKLTRDDNPDIESENRIDSRDSDFCFPLLQGTFTGLFSKDRKSGAVHVVGSKDNDQVIAVADGKVIFVAGKMKNYNNLIIIEHGSNVITTYANLDQIDVSIGDTVKRGQPFAKSVKRSDGKRDVTFSLRIDGAPVDPGEQNFVMNCLFEDKDEIQSEEDAVSSE